MSMTETGTIRALALTVLAATLLTTNGQTPSSADALINKLVQKGILSESEAKELISETAETNRPSASKWKLSDSVKSIGLYGDVRFRYEYRGADNAPGSGASGGTYQRERFRYAVRIGIRGDLFGVARTDDHSEIKDINKV